MLVVAAVELFRTDVWLALAALVVLPLAVVANLVFQRQMSPAAIHAQQLRAEVADIAHESFEAAVLVTSLGTEAREEARFAARAAQLRDANVRVGIVRAMFDPVIDLLPEPRHAARAGGGHRAGQRGPRRAPGTSSRRRTC